MERRSEYNVIKMGKDSVLKAKHAYMKQKFSGKTEGENNILNLGKRSTTKFGVLNINGTTGEGGESSETKRRKLATDGPFDFNWFTTIQGLEPYERMGKCAVLLICNHFDQKGRLSEYTSKERKGAKNDVKALNEFFKSTLNLTVMKGENLSGEQLDDALENFKVTLRQKENGNAIYDSFIVVVMSHNVSDPYTILMDDLSKKNIYNDIVYNFGPQNLNGFDRKPKIFIFPNCQGQDGGVKEELKVPRGTIHDALVCFATIPFHPALREEDKDPTGSFYIQDLTTIFRQNWKFQTLGKMLNVVADSVAKKTKEAKGGLSQVSSSHSIGGFRDYKFQKNPEEE